MRSGKPLAVLMVGLGLANAVHADERGLGLRASLQADDRSGTAIGAGLDLQLAERSWFMLDGARSDAGADFGGIESSLLAVGLDHRFEGPVGITLGWETWGDSGLVETATIRAGLNLTFDQWRWSLDGSWRDTEMDLVVPNLPATDIIGKCDGSDSSLGASLSWSGERGGWYLRGRDHSYQRTLCTIGRFTLDIFNLPPQVFIRVPALERLQASAVNRTYSFLEQSVTLGGHLRFGSKRLNLEYIRDKGAFDQLNSNTVVVTLGFEFTRGLDLGFSLGVTDTEQLGSTSYAGINVAWYR